MCRQESSDSKRGSLITQLGKRVHREGDFDWLYFPELYEWGGGGATSAALAACATFASRRSFLRCFLATRLASFSRKKAALARCSRGGASMCEVRSVCAPVERGACGPRWAPCSFVTTDCIIFTSRDLA